MMVCLDISDFDRSVHPRIHPSLEVELDFNYFFNDTNNE